VVRSSWHVAACGEDFPASPQHRYRSVEWRHHDFTRDCESATLRDAARYVQEIYLGSSYNREIAHLIFLAAGEALLDPAVAVYLQGIGIDAPVWTDEFASGFEYIVVDEDQTVKANYCEIVLVNRVTARLQSGRA
jgi:hypothetical protein